jgi:hypothetical protein
MKLLRHLFITLLILAGSSCIAQEIREFVVVKDVKDSFVNVRKEASAKSKVERKIANGTVVYALEEKDNWISVEFFEGDKFIHGYVYKSFATLLATLKEIKPNASTTNSAFFSGGGIAVTITKGKFLKDKHTYSYYKDSDSIEKVDGEGAWGTGASIPTTQYTSITATFGEQKVELPITALKNLFDINLDSTLIYYDSITDTLYITAVNGDGAAGYCVAFIVQGKKYKDRALVAPF